MATAGGWVLKPPGAAAADSGTKLRLFCFPMAGQGAYMYHGWAEALAAEGVEVCPVELPGHNSRSRERPLDSIPALAEAAAAALLPLLEDKPFALFGHSMGAWVAFGVAQELQARGGPLPAKLYASGNRSPTLAGLQHDVDPVALSTLPSDQFWQRFEARYGLDPLLEDRKMRQLAERTLRPDFKAVETYRPASAERLPCPVLALGGAQDKRCPEHQLAAWREVAPEGGFQQQLFDGGHDYVSAQRGDLLSALAADLRTLLLSLDPPAAAATPSAAAAATVAAAPEQAACLKQGGPRPGTAAAAAVAAAGEEAAAAALDGLEPAAPAPPAAGAAAEAAAALPAGDADSQHGAAEEDASSAASSSSDEPLPLSTSADGSLLLAPPQPPAGEAAAGVAAAAERKSNASAAVIAVQEEEARPAPSPAPSVAQRPGSGGSQGQVPPPMESMGRQPDPEQQGQQAQQPSHGALGVDSGRAGDEDVGPAATLQGLWWRACRTCRVCWG